MGVSSYQLRILRHLPDPVPPLHALVCNPFILGLVRHSLLPSLPTQLAKNLGEMGRGRVTRGRINSVPSRGTAERGTLSEKGRHEEGSADRSAYDAGAPHRVSKICLLPSRNPFAFGICEGRRKVEDGVRFRAEDDVCPLPQGRGLVIAYSQP